MAWTAPRDWTNGEIVTQTMLNTDVRDNMKQLWHEVAYVEFSANVTLSGTTDAAAVTVVSAGSVTYGGFPVTVEFYCPSAGGTGDHPMFNLWAATDLGRIARGPAEGGADAAVIHAERRLTPSAGAATYLIKGWSASGTAVATAGAGGVATYMPGYIRIWEKGGA